MWHRVINIRVVDIIIVNILLLSVGQPLLAHGVGGVLQIADHQLGPYTVNVWTTPSILRPGAVHVETAVSRGGGSVLDCDVQVTLRPQPFAGPSLTSAGGAATVDNDFRHEAAFRIEQAGTYQVDVTVLDPHGRGGQLSMEIEVVRIALWFQTLIYGLLAVSGLMGLFLLKQGFRIAHRVCAVGV